jgi:hypothetical protein
VGSTGCAYLYLVPGLQVENNMTEKVCSKCKELVPITGFRPNKCRTRRDGLASECNNCHNAEAREYAKRHRKENSTRSLLWAKDKSNRPKINKARAIYRANRREQRKPEDLVDHNIRELIRKQITKGKKCGRTFDLLGYTREDLMKHLEKGFDGGMSWGNYGKWHIDHIIPKSAFNITSYEDIDFKRCWSLQNLQPLWAEDNMKKYNKLQRPFQPALSIGVAG